MLDRNRFLLSLLLIRIGLGAFFIILSLEKMFNTQSAIEKMANTYSLTLGSSSMVLLGACQLVFSLLFIFGAYKNITYLLAITLQIISTVIWIVHAPNLFYGEMLIGNIPILFSLIALFLCRNFDTRLSLGKRKTIFS